MRLAVILAALLPISAQAETVFANASGCARLAGENLSDDVVIWTGDAFEFWESGCPITNVTQVGGGAVLATLACSGEGETWEAYMMIEATSDNDRFIVYREDNPEVRTEITTCQ